jgi:outer membrane receptor protein involved in Fe transport
MKLYTVRRLFPILLLILTVQGLLGQALNSGTILGTVRDPSGAGVPQTKILSTRSETSTVRETSTDGEGNYRFLDVAPGTYRLEMEHAGFRKEVREQVAISAGQSLRVDGSLTIGSVSDAVVIDEKVAEVDTNTANVGSTVYGSQVRELALNTRSFTQLMTLQPGVASSQAQQPGFGSNTSVPFSFNGAQQSSNNWLVDGGRNIDTYNGNNLTMVNLDAIAEVRIERNAYSVEYGRNSGAQINVITKSGTNAIHGSLFEFFRNDIMDARNFFASVKPKNRYNNFGGTIGGPLRKDKLFLFLSNEYRRIIQTTGTRTTIVPTAAQLAGNFSGGRTISDPTTKIPFPGNQIPPSLFDPSALTYLNTYYARPTPGFQQGALNFSSSAPDGTKYRSGLGRMDYIVSPTLSLFGRYNIDSTRLASPFGLFVANPMPDVAASEQSHVLYSAHTSATWSASPNVLNEFTTDWFHSALAISTLPSAARARAPSLNVPRVFDTATDSGGLIPSINLSQGYASLLINWPQNISGYTYEVFDNLSYVVGRHSFKFGAYLARENKTQNNSNPNNNGSFTFDGSATGDALADLLTGRAFQYTENSAHLSGSLRYFNLAGFAQDQWRVNSRLSLTYGLRYEFFQPEQDNAGTISYFDPARFDRSLAPQIIPSNGQIVTGTQNFGNGIVVAAKNAPYVYELTNAQHNNWSPRAGFSYALTKDNLTVLRGGYGRFFDRWSQFASGARNNYPFNQSVSIINTSFSNPGQGSLRVFPISLTNFQSPWQIPYMQKWSLGIQRQLPAGLVLDASYVGSKGTHLILTRDINQPVASAIVASVQVNPNAVRPYPGFASINTYETTGNSIYHSLQGSVVKRLSAGFSIQGSYTWSKLIDNVSTPMNSYEASRVERGIASFDRTHVFTASYIWEVPFAHELTGWRRKVLDGWQISGITSVQSGNPITPLIPLDRAGVGSSGQRPNVNGPVNQIGSKLNWFDTSVFSLPALGTFGNAGRSLVRGPGIFNSDVSFSKSTALHERLTVQFRAEFFNIFNHTQWSGVGSSVGASTFGQVVSARDPRITQLGLRVAF